MWGAFERERELLLLRPASTYSILQGGSTGVWDAKIKISLSLVFFWNLEQTEGKGREGKED